MTEISSVFSAPKVLQLFYGRGVTIIAPPICFAESAQGMLMTMGNGQSYYQNSSHRLSLPPRQSAVVPVTATTGIEEPSIQLVSCPDQLVLTGRLVLIVG